MRYCNKCCKEFPEYGCEINLGNKSCLAETETPFEKAWEDAFPELSLGDAERIICTIEVEKKEEPKCSTLYDERNAMKQLKIEAKSILSKRDCLLLRERIVSATSIIEAYLEKQSMVQEDDDVIALISSACVFLKDQFDGYLKWEDPLEKIEIDDREGMPLAPDLPKKSDRTMWDRPKKRPGAQDQVGE